MRAGGCGAEALQAAAGLGWPAHAWLAAEEEGEVERVFPGGHPADEMLLMAVPKRKTTPSRKGIRSTGKHLRFASVYSTCATCGKIRRQHAHCPFCLGGGPPKAGSGGEAAGGDAAGGAGAA